MQQVHPAEMEPPAYSATRGPSLPNNGAVNDSKPKQVKKTFFNFLLLSWLTPLMLLGAKRPLESKDLLELADCDKAQVLSHVLDGYWIDVKAHLKGGKKPSLFKALFPRFAATFFTAVLCLSISVGCALAIPTLLKNVILYLTPYVPRDSDLLLIKNGYAIAFAFFALQIGTTVFGRSGEQLLRRLEVNLKSIIISAVYEKSLRLSQKASVEFTQGQILNLINVDSERVGMAVNGTSGLWATPIQIVVAVVLLGQLLGYSVWAGAGTLFVVLLLQGSIIGFLIKYQQLFLKAGDRRLKLLREMLYGMKIVKLRSLEDFFFKGVSALRGEQVSALKFFYIVNIFFVGLLQVTPVAMPIVAFITYSTTGGTISPVIVFPALSLFNILFQPLLTLPGAITSFILGIVSWNRVSAFLMADEADSLDILVNSADSKHPNSNTAISFKDATFQWDIIKAPSVVPEKKSWFKFMSKKKRAAKDAKDAQEKVDSETKKRDALVAEVASNGGQVVIDTQHPDGFRMESLNFDIPKNSLTAVVGAVGSGKSSLLSAIIGEMTKHEGSLEVFGSIAYCDQQSWILTETIQGNILFETPMNPEVFDKVVESCCLASDFKSFPAGQMTEIGEKGVNLSGGQKARVSLARALYQDTDIYLLDDPLSALDASVGEQVFEKAILGSLAKKTTVLVTHQLHFLPQVDHVIVMDTGKIVQQGTFASLMKDESGSLFRMMKSYKMDDEVTEKKTTVVTKESVDDRGKESGGAIIATEELFRGSVKGNTYWSYARACGGNTYVITIIVSALFAQIARLMTDLWLSWWTAGKYDATISQSHYLYIYSGLGASQVVFALILNTTIVTGAYSACKEFHKRALASLVNAPMSFFDSQPIGRILNRMSKDVESIDQVVWLFLFLTIISSTGLVSVFVLLIVVSYIMLALVLPLIVAYYFILKYYQNTNRELRRLEATQRSPLYAHVSESLQGIASVKAFKAESRFVKRQRHLMDESTQPSFLKLNGVVWVNIRIELLSSSVALLLIILGVSKSVDTNLIGLALTYAIGLQGLINLLLLAFAQLESELNAVERLDLYADSLPSEKPLVISSDPLEAEWPKAGEIVVKELELRYVSRPDFPVLRGLNFTIKGGEKVGVVGRTGSGKSSLMTALFRLVELSAGQVIVDGIDVATLGLKTLRSRLQIIPQEPVLFTGTIRSNLDVETEFSDVDLWNVLERIGLKKYVSSLADKLDSAIAENGENLSVGQRQLLCLGRAILKKPRILVLDEATASVDREADELIQQSIKTHFKNSTVISIAHRLNTVADFDRILVLSDGKMIEFESPHVLLSRSGSLLSQLADATGPANAALLRDIAYKASL